jgi:hypothetical protein
MSLLLIATLLAATAHSTITVAADRVCEIDLLKEDGTLVASKSGTREATFTGIEPGVYRAVMHGEGPLQRLAAKVVVGRADVRRVELAPKPRPALIRVTRGGKPAAGTFVELMHTESQWRAKVPSGVETELWEGGTFTLAVRGSGLVTPFVGRIELHGGEVAIDIPAGTVGGFVRDATGAAVANAAVMLKTTVAGRGGTVRTATDGMGRFDFTAVRAGRQSVRVAAPGYLWSEPVTFDGDTRDLDVAVDHGVSRQLTVAAADGTPIAGAYIAAVSGSAVVATSLSDADGKATIATTNGGATLFVVPKDGSFAIRRIGADEKRVRVDVPAAAASLEVALLTTSGTPIPDISLLLRYNGELVPPDVARELERRQRLKFVSGSDGRVVFARVPRGVYELWPYGSEEEAEAIVASASALEAPANVQVVTGENRITMRFRSR